MHTLMCVSFGYKEYQSNALIILALFFQNDPGLNDYNY